MVDSSPPYHIDLFYSPEDKCWIANVPDLKYCSAHGHTPEEAAREIKVAMELWLECWLEEHDAAPQARYGLEPISHAAA